MGISYAALRVPANSVGTKQLRNGAVTAPKLGSGAVTAGRLGPGAVSSANLAAGAITTANVPAGAGVSIFYESGAATVGANTSTSSYAACPAGKAVVGGGILPSDFHVFLNGSLPYNSKTQAFTGPGDSWLVYVTNTDTASHTFTVYATCLVPSAVH